MKTENIINATPNFIYSITGEPAWIEWESDAENKNGAKLNSKGKGKSHELDILNWASITANGKLKYPTQNFYDNKFIEAINKTSNKQETIRYINHHYRNTQSAPIFLDKIDRLLERKKRYPIDQKFTEVIRPILMEWYNAEIEKYPQIVIEQVEEKNTSNIPESENLVAWKKKYRKIKKEFDAIKNYPDKLDYWKTNLCSKESIYWDLIPRYFLLEEVQERELPENQVCIFPEHSNDKELFCDWVFNLIEEDDSLKKHSFNKLKLAFNETIGKTPLPKEFILSELKEIEYQRDKEKKNCENKLQLITWAYYYGYTSVVKGKKLWIDMDSELFYKLSLSISKGVADAYYYSFLKDQLGLLERIPYATTNAKKEGTKTLSDLITHENKVDIVEKIKTQYSNIKGKQLKLLLIALQDLKLFPKDRQAKQFHECCRTEFTWNISSYNAMNGYNYNDKVDEEQLNEMKAFLIKLTNTK